MIQLNFFLKAFRKHLIVENPNGIYFCPRQRKRQKKRTFFFSYRRINIDADEKNQLNALAKWTIFVHHAKIVIFLIYTQGAEHIKCKKWTIANANDWKMWAPSWKCWELFGTFCDLNISRIWGIRYSNYIVFLHIFFSTTQLPIHRQDLILMRTFNVQFSSYQVKAWKIDMYQLFSNQFILISRNWSGFFWMKWAR